MMPLKTLRCTALLFSALFITGQLLAACSPGRDLPAAAEQALQDYWQSLPSSGEVTNEITRAWQGDASAAELLPGTEVWCVDAVMSAPDPEADGQTMRWLVVRTGENSPWTATLLAAMSSTWPYEACGE